MLVGNCDRKLSEFNLESYRKTFLGKIIKRRDGRVGASMLCPFILADDESADQYKNEQVRYEGDLRCNHADGLV